MHVMQTEKTNQEFKNLREAFIDNKLNIHFGEEKTKSILFASKQRAKNIHQLNVKYKDINTKEVRNNIQHLEVISWMHARWEDLRRTYDSRSYQ